MKKPSRVFNNTNPDCGFDHPDWEALDRELARVTAQIFLEAREWEAGGTRFLDATTARRSQNFFLTAPQKMIQSPTHERKF